MSQWRTLSVHENMQHNPLAAVSYRCIWEVQTFAEHGQAPDPTNNPCTRAKADSVCTLWCDASPLAKVSIHAPHVLVHACEAPPLCTTHTLLAVTHHFCGHALLDGTRGDGADAGVRGGTTHSALRRAHAVGWTRPCVGPGKLSVSSGCQSCHGTATSSTLSAHSQNHKHFAEINMPCRHAHMPRAATLGSCMVLIAS